MTPYFDALLFLSRDIVHEVLTPDREVGPGLAQAVRAELARTIRERMRHGWPHLLVGVEWVPERAPAEVLNHTGDHAVETALRAAADDAVVHLRRRITPPGQPRVEE